MTEGGRAGVRLDSWKVPVGLALWVFILYANTLGNNFHYDDTHSLIDNTSVRSLGNVGRFFLDPGSFSAMPDARMYRPLLLVTYAVNYAIDGYDAFGYHLFNVLLHAANACLVWHVARRVLGGHGTALTAALLFATHPVVSESVNYVSSRSTSLAALFVLGAVIALVDGSRRPSWRHHAALTVLAAAALLSKSVGVVLLPAAALWLWLLGPGTRASWTLLVGPAVAAGAYVMGTRVIVGKALFEPVRTLGIQVATQLKAIPFYAYTNLMPAHLSVEPQFFEAPGVLGLVPLLALALTICMAAAVVVLRRMCPAAAFGAGWFAVTLAPSSVVSLNVLVNEHRLYLPLVGGVLLAGALLGSAGARLRAFAPALLAVWAVLVWQRNGDWVSEETIWLDAARKGPAMPRVHVNLGKGYLESERYEEAIVASRRGLALDPDISLAHYNIGTAYLSLERYEEAVASFEAALELQPGMMEALNNLGNSYQHQGRYELAIDTFREALAAYEWSQLHHNLGAAFLAAGSIDSALAHFQSAFDLTPADRETTEGLARALIKAERLQSAQRLLVGALREAPDDEELLRLLASAQMGMDRDHEALATFRRSGLTAAEAHLRIAGAARERHIWRRAREHYEAGLETAPEDARLLDGLGTVLVAEGEWRSALVLFRRAAEQDPVLATSFRNIGLVNLHHHRLSEALAALERARDLDTDDGKTWELLGRAYALGERRSEAIAAYDRAIELQPARAELFHNLAVLHEANGQMKEAERLYRKAIRRDPEQEKALYNLGYLLLEQERWAEAVTVIEDLLEKAPGQVLAYVNLANAYLNLGDAEGAIEAYERFLILYNDDDDTRRKVQRQLLLLRETLD